MCKHNVNIAKVFFVFTFTLAILLQTSPNLQAEEEHASKPSVSTVLSFNPTLGQFPEGLAIDKHGNIYAALTATGQIWRISPDGRQEVFAHIDVGSFGLLVGLAVDRVGNLYVCDASFVSGTHGIWRVHRDGTTELFAALDPNGFPNAMAFDDDGDLYVTDSFLAQIYKISPSGETRVWIADPLLVPAGVIGVGANGIEFDGDFAYVANTDQGTIVRIRATDNPPRPEVFVKDPALVGADGIAFDLQGNLYAVMDIQNTLVRVSPGGEIATLATAKEGLDYPASVSFGHGQAGRSVLYWTNGGINFFTPGIQKLDVEVPGVQLRGGED